MAMCCRKKLAQVAWVLYLIAFVCSRNHGLADDGFGYLSELGFAVPAEFEIEYLAANRDMADGAWRESLRHIATALEMLEEPRFRKQLAINHSYLKYEFLALRAKVFGEMGCQKQSASQYEVAQRVLQNLANNRRSNPKLPKVDIQQSMLEFTAIRIFRPVLDYGMGFSGLEPSKSDLFRWKEAIRRCENFAARERADGTLWFRQRGGQLIEMARGKMQPPWLGVNGEPALEKEYERLARYGDAKTYLQEAERAFESRPAWKKMFPKRAEWQFKAFDDFKEFGDGQQGAGGIKSEAYQRFLHASYIDDFIELRLAQNELQARMEAKDDALGWDLENADAQFESMIATIRSQFSARGDDHPMVFRARLCRAKWWCFRARHKLEQLEKLVANDPNGALRQKEALALTVGAYARDAIRYVRDIQKTLHPPEGGGKVVMPLIDEACAGAELCAHETILRLNDTMKNMPKIEVDWRLRRVGRLRDQIKSGAFGREVCKTFGPLSDAGKK